MWSKNTLQISSEILAKMYFTKLWNKDRELVRLDGMTKYFKLP